MFIGKSEFHIQWNAVGVWESTLLQRKPLFQYTSIFRIYYPTNANVITTNDFQMDFCPSDSLLPIPHGHIFFLPHRDSSNE